MLRKPKQAPAEMNHSAREKNFYDGKLDELRHIVTLDSLSLLSDFQAIAGARVR